MQSPVLAFGFEAPWILAGLVAGGIPVLIHLLYRRRYRPTPWAAMQFLIEAARKNSQFLQIQQLILLLIRVLVLVLVVLALAQPFLSSLVTTASRAPNKLRVVLVDTSFSMGLRSEDGTCLERAKKIVRDIGDQMQTGDVTHLVTMPALAENSSSRAAAGSLDPLRDQSHLLERLDSLALTQQKGHLPAALQGLSQIVKDEKKIAAKEVIIISDFQRSLFQQAGGQSSTQLQAKKVMKELADQARLTLVDVGQQVAENSTVSGIRLPETFLSTQDRIPLEVNLHHFGSEQQTGKKLELFVDDRPVSSQIVDLSPGVTTSVTLDLEVTQAGRHRAEVRLEDDSLPVDNQYWFEVNSRKNLTVLIVNGQPSDENSDDSAVFLSTALSPSTERLTWRGMTKTTVIRDNELPQQNLADYACVILSNVALITPREAEKLMAYAAEGGGVVFFMGEQVQAANYNNLLFDIDRPLLPARLDGPLLKGAEPTSGHIFDPLAYKHKLLSDFRGNTNGGLTSAITWNYMKTTLPANQRAGMESADVALAYSSNDAAILEKRFQKGIVFLVTTSANLNWGTWPLQSSFPPLVHQLVRLAAAGGNSEAVLKVGEPYVSVIPSQLFKVEATVTLPRNETRPASIVEQDGRLQVSFGQTDRSGWYRLDYGAPLNRSDFFAVNTDIAESDLATVTADELRNELFPETRFSYRRGWSPTAANQVSTDASPNQLVYWLLLAALGLLLVEQLMAWQFVPGVALFGLLIVIVLILQAWYAQTILGMLVAAVTLVGVVAAGFYASRRLRN